MLITPTDRVGAWAFCGVADRLMPWIFRGLDLWEIGGFGLYVGVVWHRRPT